MKNDPILMVDLANILKKLPNIEKFPLDTVAIPFTDSFTKEERSFVFSRRKFINKEKEEKYWVLVCFIADKGRVQKEEGNG